MNSATQAMTEITAPLPQCSQSDETITSADTGNPRHIVEVGQSELVAPAAAELWQSEPVASAAAKAELVKAGLAEAEPWH